MEIPQLLQTASIKESVTAIQKQRQESQGPVEERHWYLKMLMYCDVLMMNVGSSFLR